MARFALSRWNSVFWRNMVRCTACTFSTDFPNGIATGESGGPCSIRRGDDHHQIPIAGLADRGFVQQGFCNATRRRMRGLALGAGRRRNLIIVRRIFGGSTEPFNGRTSLPSSVIVECFLYQFARAAEISPALSAD
jgi:hypothetical protein